VWLRETDSAAAASAGSVQAPSCARRTGSLLADRVIVLPLTARCRRSSWRKLDGQAMPCSRPCVGRCGSGRRGRSVDSASKSGPASGRVHDRRALRSHSRCDVEIVRHAEICIYHCLEFSRECNFFASSVWFWRRTGARPTYSIPLMLVMGTRSVGARRAKVGYPTAYPTRYRYNTTRLRSAAAGTRALRSAAVVCLGHDTRLWSGVEGSTTTPGLAGLSACCAVPSGDGPWAIVLVVTRNYSAPRL